MSPAFIYSFAIGFVGAVLFLLVDKFERNSVVANLLKFLLLVVSSVAIFTDYNPSELRCFDPWASTAMIGHCS